MKVSDIAFHARLELLCFVLMYSRLGHFVTWDKELLDLSEQSELCFVFRR